jgi:DNA modification methylase
MKPYYHRDGITLYHCRSEDILPALPPESIDLLLTDPPYGVGYKSRAADPDFCPTVANDHDLNALRSTLPLIDRLLRPDRHAYIFAAPAKIGEASEAVAEYWKLKNQIVWDKGNQGTRGDCQAGYSVNWEAIIYASKGRRALVLPRPRAVIRFDWSGSRDPVHPTVKPVGLFCGLIGKSTLPGETVLDPFCGSGPALQAAAQLGRQAIGIELEERYCETAARRVDEILNQKQVCA